MPPYDDTARAQMKEWIENWKRIGPLLDAERIAYLRRLDDRESARIAVELLWAGQPVAHGDDGAGLVAIARAQRLLAERSSRHRSIDHDTETAALRDSTEDDQFFKT